MGCSFQDDWNLEAMEPTSGVLHGGLNGLCLHVIMQKNSGDFRTGPEYVLESMF